MTERMQPSVADMKADLREANVKIHDTTTKAALAVLHKQHCSDIMYYRSPVEGIIIKAYPHPNGKGYRMKMLFESNDAAKNQERMAKMERAFAAMSEAPDAGEKGITGGVLKVSSHEVNATLAEAVAASEEGDNFDVEKALALYDRVVELASPASPDPVFDEFIMKALCNKGCVQMEHLRDYDAAIASLKRAVKCGGADRFSLFNLGGALLASGDRDGAVRVLTELHEVDAAWCASLVDSATVSAQIGAEQEQGRKLLGTIVEAAAGEKKKTMRI